ncbi:META domain-containing protein [Runella sp.]|uniref:META domain-containing protein n=1 Tax=Runella sp. TaxID=1960881 RepID=UPI003D120424
MKALFSILIPILCLLMVSACKESSVDTDTPKTEQIARMKAAFGSLDGTEWLLKDYATHPLLTNLKNTASLKFVKQSDNSYQLTGRSFVNLYGGEFSLDEEKGLIVKKDHLMTTEMAGPSDNMKAEDTYYRNLYNASFYEMRGNELWLYIGQNTDPAEEVMYFVKK